MATICQTVQNEHTYDRIQRAKLKDHQIKEDMFKTAKDYLPEEMKDG